MDKPMMLKCQVCLRERNFNKTMLYPIQFSTQMDQQLLLTKNLFNQCFSNERGRSHYYQDRQVNIKIIIDRKLQNLTPLRKMGPIKYFNLKYLQNFHYNIFSIFSFIIQSICLAPMDVENPINEQYNSRVFSDYLNRSDIKGNVFSFNLDAFRTQYPIITQDIIRNPTKYYRIIRTYLEKSLYGQEKKKYESKIDHFTISFEGNLGSNFVTPRGLNSRMANQLVGIHGIVTKMDLVKCQLEKSVHWCEKSKSHEVKDYPDPFAPQKQFQAGKTQFIKSYDDNNNPLDFQYGLSSFRNLQHIVVQQLPQMAPPGLLPQSVQVILQGELVNSVKPGDRVELVGIYKLISGGLSKEKGIFKPFFLCLSTKLLNMTLTPSKMTSRIPCHQSELFSLFSRSIAPSIYGHEQLKKAVLLMLLGGCEKILENGTHLRGDINILMVGDPGTAKSQILRWVLSTVDVGIGTTGSGASGVGLTAAIVNQRQTGEKTLEAGAMVLADRGVVCIDQFDKMNEIDRVAVHEVMEQQTVTIAKAGIHCSLNARCSVIAAANPIFGQYLKDKPPTKNIGMADSLLSRFDLIFIIFDEKNADIDKRIAERVCRNHRLAPLVNEWSSQFSEDDEFIIQPIQNQKPDDSTYQKSNVYRGQSNNNQILTQSFLKKYINYCKANVRPILSDNAITLLASLWTVLRQRDSKQRESQNIKVLPITIRSYETLIRLSTAHAKLRQSHTVEIWDCVQGFRLMAFCLEGSQNALDDKLEQILKENGLHLQFSKDKQEKTNLRKQKGNKKEKQEEELIKGIQKIEINKEEKEVERVIKKVKQEEEDEAIVKEVFKSLANYRNKVGDRFLVSNLRDFMKKNLKKGSKFLSEEELLAGLQILSFRGKISLSKDGKEVIM